MMVIVPVCRASPFDRLRMRLSFLLLMVSLSNHPANRDGASL